MVNNDINQVLAQMRAITAAAEGKTAPTDTGNQAASGDFGKLLKASINEVNQAQKSADNLSVKFDKGDPNVALGDVMVAVQKANLSFDAMTQVRNRLVAAYKNIMNMQA